jgi:hypothetical protein
MVVLEGKGASVHLVSLADQAAAQLQQGAHFPLEGGAGDIRFEGVGVLDYGVVRTADAHLRIAGADVQPALQNDFVGIFLDAC